MIISLCGFMGSGKSTTGRYLADMLGYDFVDLDGYVEHKKGVPVGEIIRNEGVQAFRAVEAECLRDVIIMHQLTGEDMVLALGGGTVTISPVQDLIFGQTRCVWLQASMDSIRTRLGEDTASRPLFSEGLMEERIPIYSRAEYAVCTDGKSPQEVAQSIKLLICE